MAVRVRFPSGARGSLLEIFLRGIFVVLTWEDADKFGCVGAECGKITIFMGLKGNML